MENSLLIALSRQTVMQRHMETIANNIANASTSGFKGEQLMFVEFLAENTEGETVSYVQDIAVVRDFGEGEFVTTSNPLDVAINGKGWFVIDTPDRQAYTRNGHFSLNQQGQMVTSGGHPVLNATGSPIAFGPDETGIKISADGTISSSAGVKGQLDIVTFEDERALDKASESLFVTDALPSKALDAKVVQGMIEGSNVKPVVEITNMIWAMRSYQAAHEVVKGNDGILREAIDVITDQQA